MYLQKNKMAYKIHLPDVSLRHLIDSIISQSANKESILCNNRNIVYTTKFGEKNYVVKSFKVPHILNQLVYRHFRASKARRSFLHAERIGTSVSPEPIAYIEERGFFRLRKSYYISEKFDFAYTFNEILTDKSFLNRKKILEAFADFTFDLHELNILHLDYSRGNLLIDPSASENDNYQFRIIDVNRMAFKQLSLKLRLGNFSRMGIGDDDLRIVIYQYAKRSSLNPTAALALTIQYRDKFNKRWQFLRKLKGKS